MVWRATAAAAATIRRTPPPIASEELPVRVWLPNWILTEFEIQIRKWKYL